MALGVWNERWRCRRLHTSEWQPRRRALGEFADVLSDTRTAKGPPLVGEGGEPRPRHLSWAAREGFPEVPEGV